ncbi:hypothetical protein [Prevotella corporis]|jgi:hypothetical protein|uniref:hypothetical protein n=1 Tax=Prevotella corporis TaxID=28128 RepID=UPI000415C379|nr:hypothetical protein [Prevotella corporis]MDQ7736130.1 hypothetical protein [Prevotella corporis]
MGIFSDIFKRRSGSGEKVGGMNDYMSLVRVYFQAALASKLGITNLASLPDLRTYKQTFHVSTVNNKLGVGEKNSVRKTMKSLYGVEDQFFNEIDASIKKNCKKIQDVQAYLYQFQALTQDLMMLIGNLMKFKLRMPAFFKKAIYAMTEKTVNDIFDKNDFTDSGIIKTVMSIRQVNNRLGFSRKWITDFVFQIILLAKKEPKPSTDDVSNNKP